MRSTKVHVSLTPFEDRFTHQSTRDHNFLLLREAKRNAPSESARLARVIWSKSLSFFSFPPTHPVFCFPFPALSSLSRVGMMLGARMLRLCEKPSGLSPPCSFSSGLGPLETLCPEIQPGLVFVPCPERVFRGHTGNLPQPP